MMNQSLSRVSNKRRCGQQDDNKNNKRRENVLEVFSILFQIDGSRKRNRAELYDALIDTGFN